MEAGYIFLGIAIGIVIGQQYFQFRIKRKNTKVIDKIKAWIDTAENKFFRKSG